MSDNTIQAADLSPETPSPAPPQGTPESRSGAQSEAITAVSEDGADPQEAAEAENHSDATKLRAEAAKYRTRLREAENAVAEAVKDAAAVKESLTEANRELADSYLADYLASPSDFWLKHDLADVTGDGGKLDYDKLAELTANVLSGQPHWAVSAPAASAHQVSSPHAPGLPRRSVLDGSLSADAKAGPTTWGEIFQSALDYRD